MPGNTWIGSCGDVVMVETVEPDRTDSVQLPTNAPHAFLLPAPGAVTPTCYLYATPALAGPPSGMISVR